MRVRWRSADQTEKTVMARLYVACILFVGIQSCSRPDKNGGMSIPEIQAMIACKNCAWLVGLRSVG